MIISCTSCNKNFEINSDLIPDSGRLLACGSCNHQWFFNGKKVHDNIAPDIGIIETDNKDNIASDSNAKVKFDLKNKTNTNEYETKRANKIGVLRLLLIFIIFFITIIILVDTFKSPISLVLPNIEEILFNLYESLKDIILFLKDLIR